MYDGILASSDPGWMQGDLIALLVLFNWVSLKTNIRKTVRMVCHIFQAAGTQLEAADEQRMMGRDYHTSRGNESGCSVRSVGRSWLWGRW